ncbi:MAG: DUF4270 domain-containing protein [Bacteroidaceae bacterium]|nr:DUF4270 domain-containing protein [Bacteroidaceae bacterium]
MNHKIAFLANLLALILLTSCDEDTASLGIVDKTDLITSSEGVFDIQSSSVLLDSVVANSSKSYFGEVVDEETNTSIKAEFLAQFHTLENYTLPDDELIIKNSKGELEADSVDVRLYFENYYGDATNPMKLQVYELDSTNILSEEQTFYSDICIEDYLPAGARPLASKTFTPSDYTLPDSERISTTHYDNVRVRLPKALGTRILRAADEHPEWFVNSWQFIHHVFPGLYFKLQSGKGTMLTLDVTALNVYFRYRDAEKDTVYQAVSRFSATAEVIQSTRIQNSDLTALLDASKPYTYLKSPAGVATEMELPVDEVFQNHQNDTISRARLILTRMNSLSQSDNVLPAPETLLLLRKQNQRSFFQNKQLADELTSYTTYFDATYNTYTFSNLSRLLSYLHREKEKGMQAEGLTSAQWNAAHPDWNKVLLIPVDVTTSTTSSGVSTQVSINHDFSLTSARLVGGTEPLKLQIVYSGYY